MDSQRPHSVPRFSRLLPLLLLLLLLLLLFPQFSSNHFASALSRYFTSSMLPGGPPAQWPHIEGKTSSFPTPGFMHLTSYSESSGLFKSHKRPR